MKKFRLLGLILTLCMCFAVAMPAWAADDNTAQIDGNTVHHMLPYPPSFSTPVEPYSTSKPTVGWDFATNGTYYGDFWSTHSTLYTDCYFYLGTYLKMSFSCLGEVPYLPFRIGARCLTCDHKDLGILGSFTTGAVGEGVSDSVKLYGGKNHTGHYVYFYITNDQNNAGGLKGKLEGSFSIDSY